MSAEEANQQKKVSLFSVMKSVLAASFGVQTKANRERDFEQGKFHHYVIGGVVFAIIFVLLLVALVQFVLHLAGV